MECSLYTSSAAMKTWVGQMRELQTLLQLPQGEACQPLVVVVVADASGAGRPDRSYPETIWIELRIFILK